MWETQRIDLSGGISPSGLHIRAPWSQRQYCLLDIPRFIGKSETEAFQVDQALRWSQDTESGDRVHFALEGDPGQTGVDFHGDVVLAEPDEAHLSLSLTNCGDQELKSGRHLLFLDFSHLPEFVDPQGQRTFFFTDVGWKSHAALLSDAGITDRTQAIRVGSHMGKTTVIWDLVARVDDRQERLIAFSLNRAFAFSSDHPDWGTGLLAACRWSHLTPGERHYAMGIVYLMNSDLRALEDRYTRNRKRR